MTDRDAIALTCYGEARGETTAGRLAVAWVLKNRLDAGRWGHSYEAVATMPQQFSCWNEGDPNRVVLLKKLADVQAGPMPVDPILRECYWIADGLLAGSIMPQVRHATHYYATWLKTPPEWAQYGTIVTTIGHHTFFEHVA